MNHDDARRKGDELRRDMARLRASDPNRPNYLVGFIGFCMAVGVPVWIILSMAGPGR